MSADAASLLAHPGVAEVARRLAGREGAVAAAGGEVRRAAVALVLRPAEAGTLDLLFIKRAEYPGDPWSGQVAFPGGRHEPGDASLRDTAARETWEETGLDLVRDGLFLGVLDELWPRTPTLPPIVVRPYVAVVRPDAPLALSDEVAAAFWAPLDALRQPDATFEAAVTVRGEERRVPALRHADYTIWGMTERIFRDFLARLAAA
ncbi:MAG TPA: CoA pyrophosphatase [Gemmatimonadaceae bacterium]|nr:CoA pyrophosphatase [Gemmatimonadaceae bacterium]